MAFTPQDLAAVDAAIASGELSVRAADGRTVTYRSMADLMRARQTILAEIAASQPGQSAGGPRRFTFTTHRGD